MTVESAQFISELDISLPDPNGIAGEGDDHIRLLKSVLENTVPFTQKVLSSARDLNLLNGLEAYGLTTADLQKLAELDITATQLNRLAFTTSTHVVFHNAPPPFGWEEITTLYGSGLRVASSGGSSGNTAGNDFSTTIDLTHNHGNNIAYTAAAVGDHDHGGSVGNAIGGGSISVGLNSAVSALDHTHAISGAGAHTHSLVKTGGVLTSTTLTFNFKYTNVMICRPVS